MERNKPGLMEKFKTPELVIEVYNRIVCEPCNEMIQAGKECFCYIKSKLPVNSKKH